jgi:hypothetical protein
MKNKTIAAFLLTTMLIGTSTAAMAASKEQGSTNGQPFKALQERIDVVQMNLDEAIVILQNQIDELVDSQEDQDNERYLPASGLYSMSILAAIAVEVVTRPRAVVFMSVAL